MIETTIPHLEVTLNIDWELVSPEIHAPTSTYYSFNQRRSFIEKRCGSEPFKMVNKISRREHLLNFQSLQSIQFLILGKGNTSFRSTSAYCATRSERYAYFKDLPYLFRKKLAKDAESSLHPLVKAARLYLDIIFIHPFTDGNARAAVLSAAFYSLKHGYNLPDIDQLFSYEFNRPSEKEYLDFCNFFTNSITVHD